MIGDYLITLSSRPERHEAVVPDQNLRRGVERPRECILRHAASGSSPQTVSTNSPYQKSLTARTPLSSRPERCQSAFIRGPL